MKWVVVFALYLGAIGGFWVHREVDKHVSAPVRLWRIAPTAGWVILHGKLLRSPSLVEVDNIGLEIDGELVDPAESETRDANRTADEIDFGSTVADLLHQGSGIVIERSGHTYIPSRSESVDLPARLQREIAKTDERAASIKGLRAIVPDDEMAEDMADHLAPASASEVVAVRYSLPAGMVQPQRAPPTVQIMTPGINNQATRDATIENHTAFVFVPYFNRITDISKNAVQTFVGSAVPTSGQQYDVMVYEEPKVIGDNGSVNCTLPKFKEIIADNKKKIALLVVNTHGSADSFVVERCKDEAQQTKKYDAYIALGYKKDEIEKTGFEGEPAIGVTDKFIQRYRQLAQCIVFSAQCQGNTLNDDYVDAFGQADDRRARVALGSKGCPTFAALFVYARYFFGGLDGHKYTFMAGQGVLTNAPELRTVQKAYDYATSAVPTTGQIAVQFALHGNAQTVLAPRVVSATPSAMPLPANGFVDFTFDASCSKDPKFLPTATGSNEIEFGRAAWQDDAGTVLRVFVTAAPEAGSKTFTLTLKGTSVYSAVNNAQLDGNTNPDVDISGVGPSNDDYVLKFEDGVRKRG